MHTAGGTTLSGNLYTYNNAHNISSWTTQTAQRTYTYDAVDRLTAVALNRSRKKEESPYEICCGNEVLVGDEVIADESEGVVVSVLDTKQFSEQYPEGWCEQKTGAFVETKKWGLIHYLDFDDDVRLIKRSSH